MGREEQIEEREVLDSIFPEEITDISDSEFRIFVKLDIPGEEEEDEEDAPAFILFVRYPEEYPDTAPHLEIQAPHNATPYPHFNVGEDREQLLADLDDTIQENIGIAMIFTLVSTLKDASEQLVQDRKDVITKAQEDRSREAEREENKKFQGTQVTIASFTKWREGFIKEMEDVRVKEEEDRLAELKKQRVKEPVKLTGRQLWERGLAGKGEVEDDDGPVEGMEKLDVKV